MNAKTKVSLTLTIEQLGLIAGLMNAAEVELTAKERMLKEQVQNSLADALIYEETKHNNSAEKKEYFLPSYQKRLKKGKTLYEIFTQ